MKRCWKPLLLLLLLIAGYRTADACTPPPGGLPSHTAGERTDDADLVLLGQVVAAEGEWFGETATIKVEQYLKGQGPAEVRVTGYGPGSLCRSEVKPGSRYIFYVKKSDTGDLFANYLSQFDAVTAPDPATVAEISAAAGQHPVTPEPAASGSQPDWDPAPPLALIVVLAVAALIASGLLLLKRSSR